MGTKSLVRPLCDWMTTHIYPVTQTNIAIYPPCTTKSVVDRISEPCCIHCSICTRNQGGSKSNEGFGALQNWLNDGLTGTWSFRRCLMP